MTEPWQLFYSVWREVAFPGPLAWRTREAAERDRLRDAVRCAAESTVAVLREVRGWSLVGAHLMAGALVDAAEQWALYGSDPERLREWLREAWEGQAAWRRSEEERLGCTDAVLAGVPGGMGPAEPEEDDAFLLHVW